MILLKCTVAFDLCTKFGKKTGTLHPAERLYGQMLYLYVFVEIIDNSTDPEKVSLAIKHQWSSIC